jgi:hypothetical protein
MLPRRSKTVRPAPNIPAYGVLIGRIIFLSGLGLALIGLGFMVMLGLGGRSALALVIFGVVAVGGAILAGVAARDLIAPAVELTAKIVAKQHRSEAGNPIYELKFETLDPGQTRQPDKISYNVTKLDWERFKVGDRVVIRYSARFKFLIDIQPYNLKSQGGVR